MNQLYAGPIVTPIYGDQEQPIIVLVTPTSHDSHLRSRLIINPYGSIPWVETTSVPVWVFTPSSRLVSMVALRCCEIIRKNPPSSQKPPTSRGGAKIFLLQPTKKNR